ncbi:hypothetical protein [Sorangium sp. So ce131]|uniref:hypothetical protein n=1 Tax=Sorangium sp. So ce131 TaxID=3133282 RepID=UPI003F60BB45
MECVLNMVQHRPMPPEVREELMRKFGRSGDPEIEARRQWILRTLLADSPEFKEQFFKEEIEKGIEQGQLAEARAGLRRVLARRGLALSTELEAQIDACSDLVTLHRWHDRAVIAPSAEDALA